MKKLEEIGASSMQNLADGDATYRKKNKEEHGGFAVHATEICDLGNKIQVVTDIDVTKNNVDDVAVLVGKIKKLKEDSEFATMVAEESFVSDELRDVCKKNQVELITTAIWGRAPNMNETTFTWKDFLCDTHTGEIDACHAEEKPRSTYVHGTTAIAKFDPVRCAHCNIRRECPVRVLNTQARYVIDDKRRWIDARHQHIQAGDYYALCALRPPVEGLMSQLKPKYLKGRVKFFGIVKVKSRMFMKAIGINFKMYQRYILDIFCMFSQKLAFFYFFVLHEECVSVYNKMFEKSA